jgi:hypothetical protein
LVLLGLCADRAQAQGNPDFTADFRKFAAKHCVSCHGPEVQKRKLRLDQLAFKFDDADVAATWAKVLDRMTRGEMPPRNKPQPDAKESGAVLAGLKRQLVLASLAKQQREGRVVLRRLNRVEYETTLRDLLGAPVEVKDLLPDDNSAAGFDNVSAVLEISAVHLLRYQEAAEKALRAAIPTRPPTPIKDRRTGKQITQKMPLFAPMLGKSARLDGDVLVLHTRTYGHIPAATAPVEVAGRYRVRISAQALGTNGKAVPVMFSCRDMYGRDDTDIRTVRDAPADRPAVLEAELQLESRKVVVFNGWSLPTERDFGEQTKWAKVEGYKGPSLAIHWVEIEGPIDPWPPVGYARVFQGIPLKPTSVARAIAAGQPEPPEPAKRTDQWWVYDPLTMAPAKPRQDAERAMRAFLPLAFRRPVPEDVQRYHVKMIHDALDRKVPFPEAMILGYKAALCSPHFLFLTERVDEAKGDQRTVLDDYAVASRLSYFLWSSMPDDVLIRLAAKSELRKPEVLRAQVERMLNDAKAQRFTANFAGQWLDLRNINATSPDPQLYGEFDDFLFWSMPRETERYFEEILTKDLSLLDFVHSDWTFLNERLAKHYGIANISGGELRRVTLPAHSHRGGVLTHASVLKVTADGTRTSPVLRGKWVLEKILGQPPAPPPDDIPKIKPDIRGTTTIRQQLARHRDSAACASCHKEIDPPGFALETFDVIGGWRDFYRGTRGTPVELANYAGRKIFRGLDVEKGGETPEGKPFNDIDQYKVLLLSEKDQLARNLAEKLLTYSTGAVIQLADREVVEQLVASSRQKKYGLRSLIHEVVQSRVFLNK